MKAFYLLLFCCISLNATAQSVFKKGQMRYSRVRSAYSEKLEDVKELLKAKNMVPESFEIYLRAFKEEKKLELWARQHNRDTFVRVKTYEVCATSGEIGPKRKEGDFQIPEGFYYIDRFNPVSNFHLSMGVNYPNKSDRILSDKVRPGGDIFIHGSCVTIGCLPITDNEIKELYVFCVEAKNNGQQKIPVNIFPSYMSDQWMEENKAATDDEKVSGLWDDLKGAYDLFNSSKKLPVITFLKNGRHEVKPSI